MNLEELLDRWRCDDLSHAELGELTRQLATREGRARLRQDWLLEVSLPTALQTATLRQGVGTASSIWAAAWWVPRHWHLAWRWAAGLAALSMIIGLLGQLKSSVCRTPNAPPRTTPVESSSLVPGTEDLRDLALIVAKPPVPVLSSQQAAWLSVLTATTEGKNP
jgi:hypothetical protein